MRQPAGFAHERVAVQQHERRLVEALDQRLEVRRVGAPEDAGRNRRSRSAPAPAADRRPRSPPVLRRALEQRLRGDLLRDLYRSPRPLRGGVVEPAAVRRDRLQRSETFRRAPPPSRSRARFSRRRNASRHEAQRQDASSPSRCHSTRGSGRRKAVVDEQDLRARRAQERRRVLVRLARKAMRVDRVLRRLDAQMRGELAHGAPVREAGRDVRPLARVVALREEAAKLVERRRRLAEEPVRVVVDEADRAQYFGSDPVARMPRLPPGMRPTPNGGRPGRTS